MDYNSVHIMNLLTKNVCLYIFISNLNFQGVVNFLSTNFQCNMKVVGYPGKIRYQKNSKIGKIRLGTGATIISWSVISHLHALMFGEIPG